MSLRSEVKWDIVVHLKKRIEHSLNISVFELDTAVPSIHPYLSIGFRPNRSYRDFEVSVNDSRLQSEQYDQESCALLIPLDEINRMASNSSCKMLVHFTETNAVTKFGESHLHLYTCEYDINQLYTNSCEMTIRCIDLEGGWKEGAYKLLAALLRIKQTPKVITVDKDPIALEKDGRCDFHFAHSESPSFKILYNPRRFDVTSLVLGLIGGIIVSVIAAIIYSTVF